MKWLRCTAATVLIAPARCYQQFRAMPECQAAVGRGLPLPIALTLLVIAVTLTANAVADAVLESSRTGASAL